MQHAPAVGHSGYKKLWRMRDIGVVGVAVVLALPMAVGIIWVLGSGHVVATCIVRMVVTAVVVCVSGS